MHNAVGYGALGSKYGEMSTRLTYLATSHRLPPCPAPVPSETLRRQTTFACCLLVAYAHQINKFCLFGGERTTTIGKPSDLGEGNRDLRAIWRALSTPRDLVRALVRGQGLTDLRDMDGVVMAAPASEVTVFLGLLSVSRGLTHANNKFFRQIWIEQEDDEIYAEGAAAATSKGFDGDTAVDTYQSSV